MPVIIWLTLHVLGNIFHFKFSLCLLSFKGKMRMKGFEMNNCSKQSSTFGARKLLNLCLWTFENFFTFIYLKEDFLKALSCTRTINTVFSMIIWTKIPLDTTVYLSMVQFQYYFLSHCLVRNFYKDPPCTFFVGFQVPKILRCL